MKELSIGLVINPIAGVGAALAWKGTDDIQKLGKQLMMECLNQFGILFQGHSLQSPKTFQSIGYWHPITPLIYPKKIKIILSNFQKYTNSETTHQLVKELTNHDLDLILFAGGDGTASDVAKFSKQIPIMGIPSELKFTLLVFYISLKI